MRRYAIRVTIGYLSDTEPRKELVREMARDLGEVVHKQGATVSDADVDFAFRILEADDN